jgi:hypothetical protein
MEWEGGKGLVRALVVLVGDMSCGEKKKGADAQHVRSGNKFI